MRMRRYKVETILVVCCVAVLCGRLSGITKPESTQIERLSISTLHGLTGVGLQVIYVAGESGSHDDIAIAGLDESTVRTQVELELRKAGIKLVENALAPDLWVTVAISKVGSLPLYGIQVQMELCEVVELVRDRRLHTLSRTWPGPGKMALPIIAGQLVVVQAAKNEIDNKIKQFCNEYLAANPKDRK